MSRVSQYSSLLTCFLNHFEGYAASMALAQDDKDLIKCAISVAPPTDWLFYGKLIAFANLIGSSSVKKKYLERSPSIHLYRFLNNQN